MRLAPLEVYVLNAFRLHGREWMRLVDIADGCTINRRNALDDAVTQLESDSLVIRCFQFVELTDAGRDYLGMAGAEALERLQRGL